MYKIILIASMSAAGLLAQTPATPNDPTSQARPMILMGDSAEIGHVALSSGLAAAMPTVLGAPYSAQAVTDRVQLLADGNRIEHHTSANIARDSQGRVRREDALPDATSANPDAPHLIIISDPVAGVRWTLDTRAKTAIKMPLPQTRAVTVAPSALPAPGPENTWFFSSTVNPADAHVEIIGRAHASPEASGTKVDLGTQTIEGVLAQGSRTTRTLPAGTVGNEQPIVITTETWHSPELKVMILSKTTDPRIGETTYKLTNIQRSEPPADLFQVPEDYTIKEPTNTFSFRDSTTATHQ